MADVRTAWDGKTVIGNTCLGHDLGGRGRDGSCSGGGLRLAIAGLRNGTSGAGRGGARGSKSVDVDWAALATNALGVEVVEVTAEALVPDGAAAEGKGVVRAHRET